MYKNFPSSRTLIPSAAGVPKFFNHAEPKSDDCGLPENPIYSNYVKYLWKAHGRRGGAQAPNKFIPNNDNSRLKTLF